MQKVVHDAPSWTKLLAGFGVLFALLQGSAAALGSLRGEAGLLIAAIVVGAALIAQRVLFAQRWRDAFQSAGLAAPTARGMLAASGAGALLMCAYPIFLSATGRAVEVYPNAAWLALGIFAQAGVAEEIVFRGYLYGRIRQGRPFWRAALLSAFPFAAAHLYLFATMAWPIALTALAISVLLTFPFAWLYDLGGGTIWAPAIAHALIQGAIKLLVIQDPVFPLIWMAASVGALWLVFCVSSSGDNRS